MESKVDSDLYLIKITLSSIAYSNSLYRDKIENGELENIINEFEGVKKISRGHEGKYQNFIAIKGFRNFFELATKLINLSYVQGVSLEKEWLSPIGRIIPVRK
jgi:hypothetical protein